MNQSQTSIPDSEWARSREASQDINTKILMVKIAVLFSLCEENTEKYWLGEVSIEFLAIAYWEKIAKMLIQML